MGSDMNIIAANGGGSGAFNLILLLAIPVIFYFLLIRPQNKRRQQQLQMQRSLSVGSRVMTTSGMYATVTDIDDDGIVLEIAPGVEARFVKGAIMNVLDASTADELAEEEHDAHDEHDEDLAGAERSEAGADGAVELDKDVKKGEQKADKP